MESKLDYGSGFAMSDDVPLPRVSPSHDKYIYRFTCGEYRQLIADGNLDEVTAWYCAYYDHVFDPVFCHVLARRALGLDTAGEYIAQYAASLPVPVPTEDDLSTRIRNMLNGYSTPARPTIDPVSDPKLDVKNVAIDCSTTVSESVVETL